MTRDDILRMAEQAGIHLRPGTFGVECWAEDLERFAALVAAAERERIIAANAPQIERINAHIKELEQARLEEREACAKVCEGMEEPYLQLRYEYRRAVLNCADAIRARGTQPQTCPDCRGIGYDASGQTCGCQN